MPANFKCFAPAQPSRLNSPRTSCPPSKIHRCRSQQSYILHHVVKCQSTSAENAPGARTATVLHSAEIDARLPIPQKLHPPAKASQPTSPLHLLVVLVLLACGKAFASQSLLVAFLDLDVTALQLQSPGKCAAGTHARKVLGRVYCEHIAHYFGKYGRRPSHMEVHGVNAHQHEPKTVPAMCTTRQVREAKEAPFVVVFVLGDRGRSYKLAHESACGPTVRLYERCLLVGPVRIPQRAMHHVQRIPKLFLLGHTSLGIRNKQLDDWRRVYHPPIAFTKPTCSCCDRLLSNAEFEVQIQLLVVHRLWYGSR